MSDQRDSDVGGNTKPLPGVCRGRFACLADFLKSAASDSLFTRFKDPLPAERVYFIGGDDGPVKIGLTTNVEQRLEHLQTGSPVRLRVLAVARGGRSLERAYHSAFADKRLHGEWFDRTPIMEAEIRFWRSAHLLIHRNPQSGDS